MSGWALFRALAAINFAALMVGCVVRGALYPAIACTAAVIFWASLAAKAQTDFNRKNGRVDE